jgi:hypothetical protein
MPDNKSVDFEKRIRDYYGDFDPKLARPLRIPEKLAARMPPLSAKEVRETLDWLKDARKQGHFIEPAKRMYKKGGSVKKSSKKSIDGIAQRGKTRGTMR